MYDICYVPRDAAQRVDELCIIVFPTTDWSELQLGQYVSKHDFNKVTAQTLLQYHKMWETEKSVHM